MGHKRRYRRQQERLRAQTAGLHAEPASTSAVGALGVESLSDLMAPDEEPLPFGGPSTPAPTAPVAAPRARAKRTAPLIVAGVAAGAMLGGPIGAVAGAAVGAVIDRVWR